MALLILEKYLTHGQSQFEVNLPVGLTSVVEEAVKRKLEFPSNLFDDIYMEVNKNNSDIFQRFIASKDFQRFHERQQFSLKVVNVLANQKIM